jgi:hypothetical protein
MAREKTGMLPEDAGNKLELYGKKGKSSSYMVMSQTARPRSLRGGIAGMWSPRIGGALRTSAKSYCVFKYLCSRFHVASWL